MLTDTCVNYVNLMMFVYSTIHHYYKVLPITGDSKHFTSTSNY